jgi:amino acid adenylation domain-containing protein/thioester reductase-like protein
MNIRGQLTVHEQFAARAAQRPDGVAVVSGEASITYAELAERANQLAHYLRHNGTGHGSVVMVHMERSIDTIVALLGILTAGGVYLPVEPGVPDNRIRAFAEETGATTVITQAKDAHRFAAFADLVVTAAAGDAGGYPAAAPEAFVSSSDAAYVIYTSGSTGTPKGVVVDHGSLSHVISELVAYYGITPGDNVLQFGALSFDTSIEQIMVALTAGATLVLPDMAWAPSELPDKLRAHGVTVMDLTPAYWRRFLTELAARPVELPVRLSIVGGEAVFAEDCRTALGLMPGVRLVNAYGLTETTITSCVVDLTADILPPRGAAPVGPPLPGTTVHVLDEDLRPVPPGERGEICIGGRGVARYLSADARARERYVPDPFSSGGRLYRTGDLGAWTPEGNLEVVGRIDRQLKIRGFRVEPGEVEATLAAHELVGNVAVTDYEQHGQRRLAAYYTVPPGASLDAKELRDFAAGFLPDYLVPSAFVALPELPLKSNGKVDLAALPVPETVTEPGEDDSTVVSLFERGVARLWCQVLERDRVGPHDNFFALGGNSILAAELLAKVRGTFGVMITQVRPLIRLLLEDASLRSFAFAVQAARAGTLPGDDTRKRVDFAAESELDVPVSATASDEPRWQDPEHVFLTGATGFLGTYLLRELLATTNAVIHCLVRADDADAAMARLQSTAVHYHGDDLAQYRIAGRVVAVPGDLATPGLGLSDEDFDRLARTVDVIHHPGGLVNFIYPYSHMRPANVEGTREIIRMAARYRNIPVHYTSTMAVIAGFGTAGVRHVDEDTPLAYADHLSVGYVESKWVAEALLLKAAEQGLPVAIYRAADISGDRVTGAWNTATEMCAMKKFVVDTGTAPVAELPLDYTPVDVFAAAVAHIAANALPRGEVYHLTNPGKVNIAELVARMRARGHEIREVSWQEWLDELVTLAVENPEHPMTPFAPLFIDRCATGEMSVAEMYLEDTFPAFSRTNVENALRGSGIVIPPVDAAMLDSYLDYLTDIDFLRAA